MIPNYLEYLVWLTFSSSFWESLGSLLGRKLDPILGSWR